MSNALTPDAPVTDVAAPSVETQAPSDETAVTSGSASDGKSIPVERFNGLMSAHQRALSDMESMKAQIAALEAAKSKPEETQSVSEQNDATAAELRALREELHEERMKTARSRVLEQYPNAKPFADLIVGNDEAELESVAAAIHQRMEAVLGAQAPAEPAAEATPAAEAAPAEAAPQAPVVVGGTAAPTDPSVTERVQEAIASNNFEAFLAAKLGLDAAGNLA